MIHGMNKGLHSAWLIWTLIIIEDKNSLKTKILIRILKGVQLSTDILS